LNQTDQFISKLYKTNMSKQETSRYPPFHFDLWAKSRRYKLLGLVFKAWLTQCLRNPHVSRPFQTNKLISGTGPTKPITPVLKSCMKSLTWFNFQVKNKLICCKTRTTKCISVSAFAEPPNRVDQCACICRLTK
jgi:hypothetical protein